MSCSPFARWTGVCLLLVVPIAGCQRVMIEVMIWLGQALIGSFVGESIDKALSGFFDAPKAKQEMEGRVKVDLDDPNRGEYQGPLKFKHNDSGREYTLTNPRMTRDGPTTPWKLSTAYMAQVAAALQPR